MTLLVLLMIIWVALSGELSWANVGFGFVLAGILLFVGGRAMQVNYFTLRGGNQFIRLWHFITFTLFFLKELILASFSVFFAILVPSRLQPGVVAVPLDIRSNSEITLLANLITLTPGTLSLDVSTDRRVIYVHTIRVDDPEEFRRSIKNGFERRVMELFRT